MGRWQASWLIVKESVGVLRRDPELMLFSFLSGVTSLVVLVPVVALAFFSAFGSRVPWVRDLAKAAETFKGSGILFFFVVYLLLVFVVTFFQAGLVTIVHRRFLGQDVTVRDGFANAVRHLQKIFLWSLLTATIGLVLSVLEKRSDRTSQIAGWLGGVAWSIATCFIVPVLVLEDLSLGASLEKSADVFRKTWGESVVISVSSWLCFLILGFVGEIVFFFIILPITLTGGGWFRLILFLLISLVAWVLLRLLSQTLDAIVRVALFEYANTGNIPAGFSRELIESAVVATSR